MVMSRGVDAAMTAALAAGGYHAAVLVQVDWPGDTVRVHSGVGTLVWNSLDWLGIGVHGMGGRITVPGDDMGMAATEGQMILGGLPEEIDALLAADARGAAVQVWFALTTERAGNVLLAPPVRGWVGYVDGLRSEEDATGRDTVNRVIVPLASRASQRSLFTGYHTDEDQSAEYPGDTAGRWLRAARARVQAVALAF